MIIKTKRKNCTFADTEISTRLQRWKVLLNEYTFKLESIAGEENCMADYLSREFCKRCYTRSNIKEDETTELV